MVGCPSHHRKKMGGLFCCLEKSNQQRSAKASNGRSNDQPFYQLLYHQKENQIAKVTTVRTLEERILNSPDMKRGCSNVRDIQIFRQVTRVSPMASSPSSVNIHPHSSPSKNTNVSSRLSQSKNANLYTHLCLSSSPSTVRIQAHFSKTDRRMRESQPSPLSRGSALPILEEKKDGRSIQSDEGGEFSDGREGVVLGFEKEPCNSSGLSLVSLDSNSLDEIGCSDDTSFSTWISPVNSYSTSTSWAESSSTLASDDETSQSELLSIVPVADGVGGSAGTLASPLRKCRSERAESRREGLVSCLRKSQSEKLEKRVRFRLPEEADVCIYDAVEDEESDS